MELNFQAPIGRAPLRAWDNFRSIAPHLFLIPDTNWAFVHITKTGGTSFQRRFQMLKPGHSPNPKHLSKEEIRLSLNATEISALRFVSIVRNPFTRFRSYCHYRAKKLNTTPDLTWFAREVERGRLENKARFGRVSSSQVDWLMGPSGDIEMDALLRFESFKQELDTFSQHISLEHVMSVETPHRIRSHYTQGIEEEFTPEIVAFVREYYREDFEVFGYDLAFPPQS
jgi:hypothetical protein